MAQDSCRCALKSQVARKDIRLIHGIALVFSVIVIVTGIVFFVLARLETQHREEKIKAGQASSEKNNTQLFYWASVIIFSLLIFPISLIILLRRLFRLTHSDL